MTNNNTIMITAPGVVSVTPDINIINETDNNTVVFLIGTENAVGGETVDIVASGSADASDFVDIPDTVTVNDQGTATLTLTATADAVPEGAENLTIFASIAGQQVSGFPPSGQVTITDTSTAPAAVITNITVDRDSIGEGGAKSDFFALNFETTNLSEGETVNISIDTDRSTADASDFQEFPSTVTISASGSRTLVLRPVADEMTEGDETLVVLAGIGDQEPVASPVLTIKDTSQGSDPVVTSITPDFFGMDERTGTARTYTVQAQNAAGGETVNLSFAAGSTADASDIDGFPSTLTLDSSGAASFTVAAVPDRTTEGNEVLIIAAAIGTQEPVEAPEVTIVDSSETPALIEFRLDGSTSIIEGFSRGASYFVVTENALSGETVSIDIDPASTASASDVSNLPMTVILNSSGIGFFSFFGVADETTEGDETLILTATFADLDPVKAPPLTIEDTSTSPVVPVVTSVTPDLSTINETDNNTVTFTVLTENTSGFERLDVFIDGPNTTTDGSDFSIMPEIRRVQPDGTATFTITANADMMTEGPEQLTILVKIANQQDSPFVSAQVTIEDTSLTPVPAVTAITPNTTTIDETGANVTVTYTITTENIVGRQSVSLAIDDSGTAVQGDVLSFPSSVLIGPDGTATVSITARADTITEGPETLVLSAAIGREEPVDAAAVTINDTSMASVPAVTAITPNVTAINETDNNTVTFTIATADTEGGETVTVTLDGASTAGEGDFTSLPSTVIVGDDGTATVTVATRADMRTEGPESLVLTAAIGGQQPVEAAAVTITDTSLTPLPVVTAITPDVTGINETNNNTVTFTIDTADTDGGETVTLSLTGGSAGEGDFASLPSTVIVGNDGTATVTIAASADLTTEGAETLIVSAAIGDQDPVEAVAVTITDTSTTPFVPPPPPPPPTVDPDPEPAPNPDDPLDGLEPADGVDGSTVDGVSATTGTATDARTGEEVSSIRTEPAAGDAPRIDTDDTTQDVDVPVTDDVLVSVPDDLGLLGNSRVTGTQDALRTVLVGDEGTEPEPEDAAALDAFLDQVLPEDGDDAVNVVQIFPQVPDDLPPDTPVTLTITLGDGDADGDGVDDDGRETVTVIDVSGISGPVTIVVDGDGPVVILGAGNFAGGEGDSDPDVDIVIGDGSAQIFNFGPGDDVIRALGGDDRVSSQGGDDQLFGGSGADTLESGADSDSVSGGAGDDWVHGGPGSDTALYDGPAAAFRVETSVFGHRVTDLRDGAPEGQDLLIGIETLAFTDGTEAVDARAEDGISARGFISPRTAEPIQVAQNQPVLIDAPGGQIYEIQPGAALGLQGVDGPNLFTFVGLASDDYRVAADGTNFLLLGPNGGGLALVPDEDPQTLVFTDGAIDLTIDGDRMLLGDQQVTDAFAMITAELDPIA